MEQIFEKKDECHVDSQYTVEVKRIIFQNKSDCYAIFLGSSVDTGKPMTWKFVGVVPGLSEGEILQISGHIEHGRYSFRGNDAQIRISSFDEILPEQVEGIYKYLCSGCFPGIGERTARKIVDYFGEKTWDVIDNRPAALLEVPGIKQKMIDKMLPAWVEHRAKARIIPFLLGCGFNKSVANKIYKTYGDTASSVIAKNPYRLAVEINGIGFKTIDELAMGKLGFASFDSKERMYGAIFYALQTDIANGNVFSFISWLRPCVEKLMGISIAKDPVLNERFMMALRDLETDNACVLKGIIPDNKLVYYKPLYYAEAYLCTNILRILDHPLAGKNVSTEAGLYFSVQLSDEQQSAVSAVFKNKITVITGGPGTGKSHLTKYLVDLCKKDKMSFLLLAPTGRAAKRLEQATGEQAQTIHRALQMAESQVDERRADNADRKIKTDILIVDEASMIDVYLARSLFSEVEDWTRVVMIGDVDQLPSIGPGCVLRDLIDSQTVPVFRLTRSFRQEHCSEIIYNAMRVNRGLFPVCQHSFQGKAEEFVYIEVPPKVDPEPIVVKIASEILPKKYGFDPVADIQVLTSRRNGTAGVKNLNQLLRETVNPAERGLPEGLVCGTSFRIGDKVMQIRNNYQLNVYNGDIGFVVDVDEKYQVVRVQFDGRVVTYCDFEAADLAQAYAVTVHKAQGSEINAVVFVFHESHMCLFQRNLLYTAITRATKMVVLIGPKYVLAQAINNASVASRNSNLRNILGEQKMSYRS